MRKPVRHFRGREGTWDLGLSYAVTRAFPAVPVVGENAEVGWWPNYSLMLLQDLAPHLTPPWPLSLTLDQS